MSRYCFVADSCIYKKVCPFNGGSFLVQPSASDFQFCWNQAPYAIGKKNLDHFALPLHRPIQTVQSHVSNLAGSLLDCHELCESDEYSKCSFSFLIFLFVPLLGTVAVPCASQL